MPGIQVLGVDRVAKDFARIAEVARGPEARKIFRREAGVIRDAVRAQAPKASGTLRRSIVSFASARKGKRAEAAAFARVNILSGRVMARHGHLVEFGTKERVAKKGKFLYFFSKRIGHIIRTRRVRGMKPNDYFARGVAASGPGALDRAVADISALIK